jgi:Chorismate mutase type II.
VLSYKQFKNQIIDKKRINIILKNIKKKSKNKKIDQKITIRIWKSMIKAFIDYEYRNFKKK